MRKLCLILIAALVSGCGLIYKLPTRQGNVIEQAKLDQLEPGMTPEQVRYLLGTPLAASPYVHDRWDYVGYYRSPRGSTLRRVVSLYFENGRLARMEGTEHRQDAPDAELIEKDLLEGRSPDAPPEEPKTGVVITPE